MVKYQESEVLSKKACRLEIRNRNSRERLFSLAVAMEFFVIGLLLNDRGLEVMMSISAVLFPFLASIRLDGFKEKGDHVGACLWVSPLFYCTAMALSLLIGFAGAVLLSVAGV